MGKLITFNFVTLNGFFKGPGGDFSWHKHGAEENAYGNQGLKSGSAILFGRVTYELMAQAWTSPQAIANMPEMAEGMTRAEKIVLSRKLKKADWNNTKVVRDIEEIRALKKDKEVVVLGSGTIVTQLAEQNLIDEYQVMVDPVIIGKGTPLFQGLKTTQNLKLIGHQVFKSGVILLRYQQS